MQLFKAGNKNAIKLLAKQRPNTGSVERMLNKSIKTLSGSKNSKVRPLKDGTFAPKGTFTDKFYEDGYNLTDDFHKTDWNTFDELMKIKPNRLDKWIGPKFKKENLDLL